MANMITWETSVYCPVCKEDIPETGLQDGKNFQRCNKCGVKLHIWKNTKTTYWAVTEDPTVPAG
jgi:hypothetical protein